MKRFFKISCLILALVIVISAGIVTTIAAETSEKSEVSAVAQIIVHVRLENKTHPYIYLWNSLPTNSAMSKSYPGEKMTSSGEWYNYTVSGVTKVNALITDSTGKQYSREQKLTTKEGESTEWWFDKTRWTKYDPDKVDPVESVDLRSESTVRRITPIPTRLGEATSRVWRKSSITSRRSVSRRSGSPRSLKTAPATTTTAITP